MEEPWSKTAVRLVTVDTTVYGLIAILKSAYSLTNRAYVHIQRESDTRIDVRLRPQQSTVDADALAGEFQNELLDQRLRELVSQETEHVRDLILAHALTKTPLVNAALERVDPFPKS